MHNLTFTALYPVIFMASVKHLQVKNTLNIWVTSQTPKSIALVSAVKPGSALLSVPSTVQRLQKLTRRVGGARVSPARGNVRLSGRKLHALLSTNPSTRSRSAGSLPLTHALCAPRMTSCWVSLGFYSSASAISTASLLCSLRALSTKEGDLNKTNKQTWGDK